MAVGLSAPGELSVIPGIRLAAISAGIKANGSKDLVLIACEPGTTGAAVFTRNAFCAAPVIVAREHLSLSAPRALLINAGNANAGTGEQGMHDARQSCQLLADAMSCKAEECLPFSTGVIGENLPMDKIEQGISVAVSQLEETRWLDAASGIMTTDTIPKAISHSFSIDGKSVTITGMSKGSGMIRPDMATMLAFIATDADVDAETLQQCLATAVNSSFNCITVDGDTSTNDACVLLASGQSGVSLDTDEAIEKFSDCLRDVCQHLAQAIIRDGEGASKFVSVLVEQALTEAEARAVAYTVAHSPLVKTALFASDPNWGRILAAVGRAGIESLDVSTIDIFLGDVCIVRNGGKAADYTEQAGQSVMSQDEITIQIRLGRGQAATTVWTSDLSYDYVKINAEYRT